MRITLRQLEYVDALARRSSFRKAAEDCLVSQPGLSKQIQQIEQILGTQLFDRDRRRVRVTESGREVVRRARAILSQATDLERLGAVAGEPLSGTLRLGVIPTIAPYLLPRALVRVRRAYPRLRLLLREDRTATLVEELRAGRIDVALLAIEADLGHVARHALLADPFLAVAPSDHELARRAEVGIDDLRRCPLLLLDEGHCLSDQILDLCEAAGGGVSCDVRASSMSTLLQMVANGIGVTLVPQMAVAAGAIPAHHVRVVPFRDPPPARTIGLCWRPGDTRSAEFQLLGAELVRSSERGTAARRDVRTRRAGDPAP
jgi:LysR family hydrogen peroxide-inducible transcriptional activator